MFAVIDEAKLSPVQQEDISLAFTGLTELLDRVREDGVVVRKHSAVWEAPVTPALCVYDVLFTPGHLDEDVRALLQRQLDRLPDCGANSGFECALDELKQGNACALLVIPCRTARMSLEGEQLFFVGTMIALQEFYRLAPEIWNFSEVEFVQNAARAYPNLYLKTTITRQLDKFSRPYRSIRADLSEAMGDINDRLPRILKETKHGADVSKRFNAESRFAISPESSKTRANKAAMKLRDVMFRDVMFGKKKMGHMNVRCEWHLKLEPHRDRIHFSFEYEKIMIGIFCEHLAT